MLIYAYNALLIAFCNLGLTLFVYLKDPRRIINVLFSLFCLSIGSWSFGVYKHTLAATIEEAQFWDLYLHLSSIFIVWILMHFSLKFTNKKRDIFVSALDFYNTLIFCLFFLQPAWFIVEITDKPHFNFFPAAAVGYYFYALAFSLSLVMTFLNLVQAYKPASSALFREQIKYFIFGMTVGFGGGSTNILAVFIKQVYPFGCFFVALFACLLAYTIVKHTLIGIDVFIKRGLLYVGLILALFIPSALLILYFQNVLLLDRNITFTVVVLSIFLFFAYSFYKLNQLVEPKLIKISGGKGYNYEQILERINFGINKFSRLKDVLNYLAEIISEIIDVQNVLVLDVYQDKKLRIAGRSENSSKFDTAYELNIYEEVWRYFSEKKNVLFKDEFLTKNKTASTIAILEIFEALKGDILLPLKDEKEIKGVLVVGGKNKKGLYSNNDVNALKVFSLQISNILNIQSYKVIESLNKDLQEKSENLETAMEDLKSTQAQLVHSAKLASVGELAAGVAHEINNALNVSVASNRHLKKMLGQLDSAEKLQAFSEEAKEDIELLSTGMERAHHVVKSLLTFSKKNSEGFKYQDVNEGIESTLHMLNHEFTEKEIKVRKEYEGKEEIFCDLNQLNQVFFNILKNACEAVEKGGEVQIRSWREGERFFVTIRDNGVGIAEKNIGRIFDPFFTTKPIGKGTGLGLNISYNIVQAHHGKIECHSEVGKGTEFKIELPVEKEKNEQADSRAIQNTSR